MTMSDSNSNSGWPDQARCAVALTFDLDAESVWLADDPANADRPGPLSQGRFGPRVAVPLILDLLERHRLPATFFVPGRVAEDHPQAVSAIAAAGHELAAHGYTHDSPTKLSREQEADALERCCDILEGFGPRVVGYRSPSWDFSVNTLDLLQARGIGYSSNLMDDIRPYRHPDRDIVELPVQWILDDAPYFWFDSSTWDRKISAPSEVLEIWSAEFDGIHRLGGSFVLTMHPQIIGRPHRLQMLEDLITHMRRHDRVWFANCADIADAFRVSESA